MSNDSFYDELIMLEETYLNVSCQYPEEMRLWDYVFIMKVLVMLSDRARELIKRSKDDD